MAEDSPIASVTFREGWKEKGVATRQWWLHAGSPTDRWVFLTWTVIGPSLLLAYSVAVAAMGWGDASGWLAVAVLVSLGLYLSGTPVALGWRLRLLARPRTWFDVGEMVHLQVDASGLTITVLGTDSKQRHFDVAGVAAPRGYVVVMLANATSFAIPLTAFESRDVQDQFVGLVRTLMPAARQEPPGSAAPVALPSFADLDGDLHFRLDHGDLTDAIVEQSRIRTDVWDIGRFPLALFCFAFVWAAWPWTQHPGLLLFFVPCFALAGIHCLLSPWTEPLILRVLYRRAARQRAFGGLAGDCSVWFTARGMMFTMGGHQRQAGWNEVTRLAPSKARVHLMAGRVAVLTIPARAFETSDEYERFLGYARERVRETRRAA